MPAKKSGVGAIAAADFREIGLALGGSYWQVDVANATGVSKSQLTRLLKETRTADYALSQKLKGMMIQRIEALAPLFAKAPLPEYNDPGTKEAIKLLRAACKILRKGEAILPEWTPTPPARRGGRKVEKPAPKKVTKKA